MNRHINYFDIPYQNTRVNNLNDATNFYIANIALSNGSIEQELYSPYYNYVPRTIRLTEDKEGLLNAIRSYYFALADLTLYLDVNPTNKLALELYNKYVESFNLAMNQYESIYGPLTIFSMTSDPNSFSWNKCMPWEGGQK